jgi:hypothetical protein
MAGLKHLVGDPIPKDVLVEIIARTGVCFAKPKDNSAEFFS